MNEYVIFTDSSCDIAPEQLKEWGVKYAELAFHVDGEDRTYSNEEMPASEFYRQMREGKVFKTSAVNVAEFKDIFEEEIKNGKDVLYIGFSSGLSNTVNAGEMAMQELREEYPDRQLITVDTLCASAGEGLLLYLVLKKKAEGATITEVAKYAEDTKLQLCHWFTVDDLVYLKRGGRVSATAALAGTILGIKPVLHVDDEGHLINMFKVRGRKQSIRAMADKFTELAVDKKGTYFISHGDCIEDAEYLQQLICEQHGVKAEIITYVGPVIGAHSGPGTLALFFIGEHR